ncbi:MAG: hypothetical protein IJN03_01325 [Bacilli bacterium]|nr:hypothetical protein [Bacilli bacterium]
MKNNKTKLILILSGLALILIPYFINVYSILRMISVICGIIVLVAGIVIDIADKLWRIVILPILFLIITLALDFGVSHLFKTIPVFSDKLVSSKDVIVYNSLFYREYSCNGKITIDNLYKKSYLCDPDDLEENDVSSFLNNVLENYNKHKNTFVKIAGKISKLNGTYNLELQAYTLTEESTNGYVQFSDNITLEVNFNEIQDLTKYNVYDSISIIGRIDEIIKKGSNYIIRLYDSIILESDLYKSYEISVVEKNSCVNDKAKYVETDEGTYYTSCLNNIFVKYDSENVYDLSYVLKDKKITIDTLTNNSIETTEVNGNKLYNLEQFKILSCGNKKEFIIGNSSLGLESPYCDVEEPNSSEEL